MGVDAQHERGAEIVPETFVDLFCCCCYVWLFVNNFNVTSSMLEKPVLHRRMDGFNRVAFRRKQRSMDAGEVEETGTFGGRSTSLCQKTTFPDNVERCGKRLSGGLC